jgi:protein-S-isoprenylcysteine O-methyltransferase Ste14
VAHLCGVLIRWIWYALALLWFVMAFRTKRTLKHQRSWLRVWLVVVLAGVLILPRLQGSGTERLLWVRSAPLAIVALLMVAGGAAFGAWARLTIGTNWSGNVTFKEGHELIQSGPYRYVRHPIYSALLLMGLGSVLLYAQTFGFALMGFVLVVFVAKMRLEEKLMTEHFGEQYVDYRRHVKALIPFIV